MTPKNVQEENNVCANCGLTRAEHLSGNYWCNDKIMEDGDMDKFTPEKSPSQNNYFSMGKDLEENHSQESQSGSKTTDKINNSKENYLFSSSNSDTLNQDIIEGCGKNFSSWVDSFIDIGFDMTENPTEEQIKEHNKRYEEHKAKYICNKEHLCSECKAELRGYQKAPTLQKQKFKEIIEENKSLIETALGRLDIIIEQREQLVEQKQKFKEIRKIIHKGKLLDVTGGLDDYNSENPRPEELFCLNTKDWKELLQKLEKSEWEKMK